MVLFLPVFTIAVIKYFISLFLFVFTVAVVINVLLSLFLPYFSMDIIMSLFLQPTRRWMLCSSPSGPNRRCHYSLIGQAASITVTSMTRISCFVKTLKPKHYASIPFVCNWYHLHIIAHYFFMMFLFHIYHNTHLATRYRITIYIYICSKVILRVISKTRNEITQKIKGIIILV